MIRSFLLLSIVFVVASGSVWGQGAYYDATVVVRLKANSLEARQWIEDGRQGQITTLSKTLGIHTSEGYVLDETIIAVELAEQRSTSFNKRQPGEAHPLAYIAIIQYNRDLEPSIAARKISSYSFVEYAEPLPIYTIDAVPNDPFASSQYHLNKVSAPDAWDILPDSEPVIVGIVDTGIDTAHPDLRDQIWNNPGETGVDGNGVDKRFNGLDDDGNGFIDDWHGWDFAGATGSQQDNSPLPGHPHGTHVGGIVGATIDNEIGIAGVAPNIRLVPIKVGIDNPAARSVVRTADGILYAATIGADIINCSFGSSTPSFADLEIVTTATNLGSLIVGAAGNSALNQAFYPAAHPVVLSVASTDAQDELSFFSNRHVSIDVSAPGTAILSTFPGDAYDELDGTSMAAPIAAAVAAMVLMTTPDATPQELHAIIKANTDNIDSLNISDQGLIGTGRVNALKAASRVSSKFVEIRSYTVIDVDGDNVAEAGDELRISISAINQLEPLVNGRIEVTPAPSNFMPNIDVFRADLGAVKTQTIVSASNDIVLTLPPDLPLNATLSLRVTFFDGTEEVGKGLIAYTVNPSFRTIRENDVTLSINSAGNIGYNDYPANVQGEGVRYLGSPSYLFEGAFLVGQSPRFLPNSARGADPSFRDYSFELSNVVQIRRDSVTSGLRAVSTFTDDGDRDQIGLQIRETVYQPTEDSLRAGYLVQYDIHNPSDTVMTNVYASMFNDWDLSGGGSDDGCAWQRETGIGFIKNARNDNVPTVGISMISDIPQTFFAVDNAGLPGVPGIYDHFLRAEKWYMMTSGIGRENTNINDVSMMIGGGPFTIQPGETQQMVFAVSFGRDYEEIGDRIDAFRSMAMKLGLNAVEYTPLPSGDEFLYLEGGPAVSPGDHIIRFTLSRTSPVQFDIYSVSGEHIAQVFNEVNLLGGEHVEIINIPNSATGAYILVMSSYGGTQGIPIQIIP